jgi:hypothetical protein
LSACAIGSRRRHYQAHLVRLDHQHPPSALAENFGLQASVASPYVRRATFKTKSSRAGFRFQLPSADLAGHFSWACLSVISRLPEVI